MAINTLITGDYEDGIPTKVPYNIATGKRADYTDPTTWYSFKAARMAYQNPNNTYDGIGFVFSKDNPYTGVDFDHCFNPDETLKPWAQEVYDSLDSYTERSPSGDGLHILVRASILDGYGNRSDKLDDENGHFEVYDNCRYFTFTADVYGSKSTIEDRQDALNKFCGKYIKPNSGSTSDAQIPEFIGEPIPDEQVLRQIEQHPIAVELWRGNWEQLNQYPSHSEADLALCSYLARFTRNNYYQIERLFDESGLYRDKWDRIKTVTILKSMGKTAQDIFANSPLPDLLPGTQTAAGPQQSTTPPPQPGQPPQGPPPQPGQTGRAQNTNPLRDKFITFNNLFDEKSIPPRRWLTSGNILLRGAVTVVIGAGGVSKSALTLALGLSVSTGRNLIGYDVLEKTKVLIINNEDDLNELKRRLAGMVKHYGIAYGEITNNLFFTSGYEHCFYMATSMDNKTVEPSVNIPLLIDYIKTENIGLLIIDPFVPTHQSEENNNKAVNDVIQIYKHVAGITDCAIAFAHHVKKGGGRDTEIYAGDVDSTRGASALTNGCRVAITLARMSEDTAKKHFIPSEEARRLVRIDSGKMNYALMDDKATWYRLESVRLNNGDYVGVPESYTLPSVSIAPTTTEGIQTEIATALNTVMVKIGSDRVRFSKIISHFTEVRGIKDSKAQKLKTK